MSNIPADLRYAESHEWVRKEPDGTVTIGLSDHAQKALGDVVFVELAEIGRVFDAGDPGALDAEVLALVVEALGQAPVDIVTGDLGLVLAAIDALDTSAARKAALRRHVWRPARFHALKPPFIELTRS